MRWHPSPFESLPLTMFFLFCHIFYFSASKSNQSNATREASVDEGNLDRNTICVGEAEEGGREGGRREGGGRQGCSSLLPTALGAQAWGLVRALTCFRLPNTLSSSSSNSPPLLAAAVLLEQGNHLITHLAPALLRLLRPAVTTTKIHT